jgi:hypothetical protein
MVIHINTSGLNCNVVQLQPESSEKLEYYMMTEPSLMFVIASSTNTLAQQLLNDVTSDRKNKLSMPLVIIEETLMTATSEVKSVA